ncbi:MAG: DUF1989 domain-containing protein [Rhodobacteraceae bacterium]|nr:DUF1989 domain-containing protein [Paracoccaceae bacterium]
MRLPGPAIIREFSNIGHFGGGRSFPGFPVKSSQWKREIAPRHAVRIELREGDLLSVESDDDNCGLAAIVFDPKGASDPARLGFTEGSRIKSELFDSEPLEGWIKGNGGRGNGTFPCGRIATLDGAAHLRVTDNCSAWFVNPATPDQLVEGGTGGSVTLSCQPAADETLRLPDPIGPVREEFTVHRGTAVAYEVGEGEFVQIIDIEGQQCSDFQSCRMAAIDAGAPNFIDVSATRSMVRRTYPAPGLFDKFFDAGQRPLLRVVQDTCGRHDTFGMACTARGYADRGFPNHLNCSDNISDALSPYGVAPRPAWPAVNFFWNTWLDAEHRILTEESHSRPGDFVVLRAESPLICVSTACPDDVDPINGWNPTDIHVRIYRPDAGIKRAVGYRRKEDGPLQMSRESAFHARTGELTNHFAPARDLWAPVMFPATGVLGEYWACRNAVTLQDMSSLRKYDIIGPDAERLLQLTMTRDIAKLPVWRAVYALICDETGSVIDDGTLLRLGPQLFRWCCGSEESGRWLNAAAQEHGLQVRLHDMGNALPNLALQGPASRQLLQKLVFTPAHLPALRQLRWFGLTVARLYDREGRPFLLTRTGYTGELGYEIFCAEVDAVAIWDALMQEGAEFGITPMGAEALDMIRIEAGFAASGSEFIPGVDPFEAGLGVAVDLKKPAFIGREALERNKGAARRLLKGLVFDCDDVPLSGAPVFMGERQVGQVTSATRSPLLERTVALARLAVEHSADGMRLEVGQLDGRMKRIQAETAAVPFIDPKRERARA